MSDSTTNLDTLPNGGASQEVRVNELADAFSVAAPFGRRASTSSGLTWGFYGTPRYYINATATAKSNGTVALTASSTRYVSVNRSFTVAEQATSFPADGLAMAKAVTSASAVTSYEDHRDPHHFNRFLYGIATKAMADANQTLNYEEAMCEELVTTGSLTATRNLVVPLVPRVWFVRNTCTGGSIQVIGASGTGVTIATAKAAIVSCDGTNVNRITADA
jgi:hypothetical protein